jgi:anaerobic magnesium-protoporphyrin IX monomethyl ester cyclase
MVSEELDALLIRLHRTHLFIPARSGDEQLGLLYVATAAARKGWRIEVFEEANVSSAVLIKYIRRRSVGVVGFYVDHENVFPVMSFMSLLKAELPHVALVAGGPQCREWDRRILDESPCDIVVRGEGELAFSEILEVLLHGRGELDDVEGITWRAASLLRRNADAKPIDLDLFPIPERSVNPARSIGNGTETIVTARGCPFRCTFCYEGRPEALYRARSIDNVLREFEHLILERHARYVIVLDDVFTLNPKRVIEVARGLEEIRSRSALDFVWFCEARADIICKRPDMLRACVDAGLARIQIGVETGSQSVLDAYNKRLKLEETLQAVELCNEMGVLSIIGNFIIGGAHETEATVSESIAFGERLLDAAPGRMENNSTIFTPYPGTPMYTHPESFGLKLIDVDCVAGPGDNYPFATTASLSKWEILDARTRFSKTLDEKMRAMVRSLPAPLVRRHFDAFVHYQMRTRWFDTFCQYLTDYNYFGLTVSNPDFRVLEELPTDDRLAWKPLRTTIIGTSRDERLIVNAGPKRVQLSERATAVYELCGGKVPLCEFPARLANAKVCMNDDEIWELMEQLDRDRLVVFARM